MDQNSDNPSSAWVTIAHFPNASAASVAQSFLESREIPVNLKNAMFQYTLNFTPKQVRLQVPDEYVEEAHALLVEGEFIQAADTADAEEERKHRESVAKSNPMRSVLILLVVIIVVAAVNYYNRKKASPETRMLEETVVVETIVYQDEVVYSDSIWELKDSSIRIKLKKEPGFEGLDIKNPHGLELRFSRTNPNLFFLGGLHAGEFPFEGSWRFKGDSLFISESEIKTDRLLSRTDLIFMGAYGVEIKGNRFLLSSKSTMIDGYFVKERIESSK